MRPVLSLGELGHPGRALQYQQTVDLPRFERSMKPFRTWVYLCSLPPSILAKTSFLPLAALLRVVRVVTCRVPSPSSFLLLKCVEVLRIQVVCEIAAAGREDVKYNEFVPALQSFM